MRSVAVLLAAASATAAVAGPTGRTITGANFDSRGHVAIVHYWATWCVPCRVEMPVLDAFYRKHHAQGLQMLAVSIDDAASTAKLRQMTSRFAFPVARVDDVKVQRRDIPRAIPVTRVYDRTGKLVFQSRGDGRTVIDAATLQRVVTPLLSR